MPDLIDPTSDRPVYRQIADHLRQAIRNGQYGEGDALPSEAVMAETSKCAGVDAIWAGGVAIWLLDRRHMHLHLLGGYFRKCWPGNR
jgi:hypothetical protein